MLYPYSSPPAYRRQGYPSDSILDYHFTTDFIKSQEIFGKKLLTGTLRDSGKIGVRLNYLHKFYRGYHAILRFNSWFRCDSILHCFLKCKSQKVEPDPHFTPPEQTLFPTIYSNHLMLLIFPHS